MDRLATPDRNAAYMLFNRGFSLDEVKEILKRLTTKSGYIYLDELPEK